MDSMIYVIVSFPFFGLGYLIWQKRMVGLLAGFDEKAFRGDVYQVAKAGGQTAYTIAGGFVICGLLSLFIGDCSVFLLLGFITGAVLWLIIRMKKIEQVREK